MTRPARIVFGLLVLATLGAFVVTQKLKSSPPLVVRPQLSAVFSPAPDARVKRAKVSFWIVNGDDVSVSIVDAEGRIVRTLLDGYALPKRTRITRWWDGRTDDGTVAPDGRYRVRIALIHQGRTIELPRTIHLDTRPPRPLVIDVEPHVGDGPAFLPQAGVGEVTIRVRGTEGRRSRVLIYRTDVTPPRQVGAITIPFHRRTATWDGTLGGQPAPPGTYLMGLLVADRSGNAATFPRALPPDGPILGHAGVTIRRLAAAPPLTPVDAGKRAVVLVDSRGEPYRWALRRLGDPAVLARGSGSSARLRVPVPRGQSGLHVLTLETDPGRERGRVGRRRRGRADDAGSSSAAEPVHRTAIPLVVRTTRPRSVLVVLPALTWQGLNRVDDDGDGVPNTLDAGGARASAKLVRPFAQGLPAGLDEQEGALLRFLDDNLLRYDLTTDAALGTGEGPPLGGHAGVVLAGDARWITPQARDTLRRWVRDGGTVWSLGTDSLRRWVRLRGDGTLAAPTAPRATDALGGRPRQPLEQPDEPVEITIYEDDPELGLFEGTSGAFAGYDTFETLAAVAPGTRLRSAAGAEAGVPVIAAWQLGDGTAIHTGLPQLAARAEAGDLDAAALVRRIWQLLARGAGG